MRLTEPEVVVCGDENLNEKAVSFVDSILGEDESPIAVSGFDFETKVLTITDQRVLVAGEEDAAGSLVLSVDHDDISLITRDGRTLIIETRTAEEYRYRFGKDQTVEELVGYALSQQTDPTQFESGETPSIAERVRFWEEQDKINQELIPRVIRQNELLAKHIAEHDNLPELAGKAISQALAGAREEQQRHNEAALDAAKRELAEQFQASLVQTSASLRQETRKARNMLIITASGAVVVGIAALIVSLIT